MASADEAIHNASLPSQAELLQVAARNRQAAAEVLDQGFGEIRQTVDQAMRAANADLNSGTLWQQVAERLRAVRQAVVDRHRTWYQQADAVAGDARPNLGDLPQTADAFLAQLPEGFEARYPTIVQRIRALGNAENPPTFGQLHELRTQLRSDVDWYRLNSSIDDGVNKYFNNQLNEVLHASGPEVPANLRTAAQMLDATDRSYGASMAAFNDSKLIMPNILHHFLEFLCQLDIQFPQVSNVIHIETSRIKFILTNLFIIKSLLYYVKTFCHTKQSPHLYKQLPYQYPQQTVVQTYY
jgi:hypothetical protein